MQEMQEMWAWSLGWEDSPGEGNGNPLQYSCPENPMDGGAWWATVSHGRKESDTTERLNEVNEWMKQLSMHACNEWEDYSNYFGEGVEIPRIWAIAHSLVF